MDNDKPENLTPEDSDPKGTLDSMKPASKRAKFKFGIIGSIVGAIIGILVVRIFFLDWLQIMGWDAFWHGRMIDSDGLNRVFHSETFLKCVAGLIAGGVVGGFVGTVLSKMFSPAGGGSS